MSATRDGVVVRATRAWRALTPDGRIAAGAALALFVSMFLPWYGVQGRTVDTSVSAFGVFSFVEAAVLLVALGVLALLFARAERATFHLPGGDGAVVTGAGTWVALLLVWRLFDKPDSDALVGVEWGIFFALAAAGVLAWAGVRMRRAGRPEPPARRTRPYVATEIPPPPPSRPGRGRGRRVASDDQLTIPLPSSEDPE